MKLFNDTRKYPQISLLSALIIASLSVHADDNIQFNTDVLDVKDRGNISLDQFSHAGYLMPGDYTFTVRVNGQSLSGEHTITYYQNENDKNNSLACVPKDVVEELGLKDKYLNQVSWWHNGECLDPKSLDGMTMSGDLSTTSFNITVPQAYMEYVSDTWDPPSRWDNGIAGIIFDYNLNALAGHRRGGYSDGHYYNISGNGTTGVNVGPWRLRADWQGYLNHDTGSGNDTDTNLDVSQVYAYRPIPSIKSKLTVGETYYNSDIFDSFRFVGGQLESDDSMLPPNLRGYAPEVTGVAKTNAKVTVTQKGRVLYQTQVAPGPFRIQDLNDAVTGELDVKIEEQSGEVRTFTINTSDIPYLTRPGTVRYKLALGKPEGYDYKYYGSDTQGEYTHDTYTDMHHTYGAPIFAAGESSWGIDSGWSLYGGFIGSQDYNALSLGLGRDLFQFGAISFDASVARADLPYKDSQGEDTKTGSSYRLSYSKDFDDYDSQITFAGYRFSTRDFMTMDEYLDARDYENNTDNDKQLYTVTFNKQFRDLGLSVYLNYSHETYWDSPENNNFNLSLSQTFDAFNLQGINASLTLFKNQYDTVDDYGGYLSLSIPIGNNSTVSLNSNVSNSHTSNEVSYFHTIDENNNYQLAAGGSEGDATTRAYYSHQGDRAEVDVNANYQANDSSSIGLTLRGGLTATTKGVVLHRVNDMGGTRMLVDTGGVADVPVKGFGGISHSNLFGKAVIADVNSYYRSSASIDLDKLGDDVDATSSVVQGTLTEGAIGYRKFAVISGAKAMATLRLEDGSSPPFGATVFNGDGLQTGIVNDDGSVYLSGIQPNGKMQVKWGGQVCDISLPAVLPDPASGLLLPCQALRADDVEQHKTEKHSSAS
ncbi:outer membrane usher protein [Klebsiella aerogenes]|uniref:outer membrane usher protein n=1 Tax=Klebsiella aerogenes TaxID=548 RepID=UPI001BD3F397|nr:outer membrane usher protein [Klebsiella aerogenes]